MFGLLSSSQIYGLQPAPTAADHQATAEPSKSNSLPHKKGATAAAQHRRSTSSLSDTGGKFFSHLSGKSPSQFIEKFIKSELLNGYDNLKCHQSGGKSAAASPADNPSSTPLYSNLQTSSDWGGFSCLQGSYRSHGDAEFYEAVQVKSTATQQQAQPQPQSQSQSQSCGSNEVNMRSKGTSSSTILLQHYQKLPEATLEPTFNTQAAGHTPAYKKLGFGSRLQKQNVEQNSDNSQTSSRNARSSGSGSEVQRSSSGSSSSGAVPAATAVASSPERLQRRRLLQMISNYDQQNKQLHRDLAKEKRRRTEELACVVKSLICFESKLKNDMKSVNQRLVDRDTEICRLMRQNRALRKRLEDQQPDEGIADQDSDECLVLEALQCQNCRKQFYDIEVTASGTQTCSKELQGVGGKEPGSSSDDTVSSSFYGARRSVRYTSKRTAGTFRDYMRSRAMHIDDAALEQQSEENTSSISREDSQTSYEQLHNYSRAMERMHGVKPASMEDGEYSEQSSLELEQQQQQQQRRRNSSSSRSSNSRSSKTTTPQLMEEDDGIFSPTQDDEDFDELDPEQEQQMMSRGALKIVQRRCADFSEASPKQIYETTTDDWYASASDQEETTASTARVSTVKPYGHGAVNPVLECVNQILLQQSMEETLREPTPKSAMAGAASNLPRRSSLSGRSVSNGRKRVHFSTKNSMVHVPRHDDHEEHEEHEEPGSHPMAAPMISHYHPMTSAYESIYSNEYEPIGSERASNLYVDMAAAAACTGGAGESAATGNASKQLPQQKLPPALPPKPANLLKFKKSLHQLEETLEDEAALLEDDCATVSEPDYCSISEVGMVASVRVQIVADIHKAPECATTPPAVEPTPMEPEVDSDDNQSHKTEEIEEIFADIPKLPNVAAIIAPKQSASEYLMMTPKRQELQLQLPLQPSPLPSQYKRKHVPNILAEINKRMSLPSSPTTPTAPKSLHNSTPVSKSMLQLADAPSDLPLQAEFDWYNLDAEYDRSQEVTSSSKSPQAEGMLAEISEDNECLINADADEYNLDEEYQQEEEQEQEFHHQEKDLLMQPEMEEDPLPQMEPAKATQMKKNLASFEKFIEGSGLSTKPLPSKRKIYFNAPFV
ncbi:uncharacterized protein LOC111082940 isoform X2 [Drosophila obscura]|uniref:uncharacterized protein LOC111082940 isoform X2 n=1 Tax=Drosophila obscura TaxID=7282 RepID=UPI001BB245CC|nr:uncharacterized protein LOC111082940 isoform X2 [Drosophila obscura]